MQWLSLWERREKGTSLRGQARCSEAVRGLCQCGPLDPALCLGWDPILSTLPVVLAPEDQAWVRSPDPACCAFLPPVDQQTEM